MILSQPTVVGYIWFCLHKEPSESGQERFRSQSMSRSMDMFLPVCPGTMVSGENSGGRGEEACSSQEGAFPLCHERLGPVFIEKERGSQSFAASRGIPGLPRGEVTGVPEER